MGLSGKLLLEIINVNTGNAAIKAKAIAWSKNINSPPIRPTSETKHLEIAISICMIQMIRSIINQNRVITVLRLTLFVVPPIASHQLLMVHPALHHDRHYFLEMQ